jgi:hypothetical protein
VIAVALNLLKADAKMGIEEQIRQLADNIPMNSNIMQICYLNKRES